ncbi:MAG: topoisomerase DNA-binding C4 zinc finger domain-containing protein, partial [Magnetococcales bacterium]|nr:topoisomerase DNA-binding C4 zinc finger domain-containing protein [Magnetococcales bacterium]
RFLVEHFEKYVDYHFTAHLEDDLDAVSRGEMAWIPLLDAFWKPFKTQIDEKETSTKRSDITTEATDQKCPECQQPLFIKLGRFGRFLACSNYPECRFTQNLKKEGEEEKPVAQPEVSDQVCDKCQQPMLIKEGRFGKYLACSGYPACRNIQPLEKPKDTGVACPECGKGTFLEKKSRRGKIFYSCSGYPKCKKALWNKPLDGIPCPKCLAPFLTEKVTKRFGTEHLCASEGCDYREKQPTAAE